MKSNFNNFQNMDLNNMMRIIRFLSFIVQWSLISMILNLFTMGLLRFPLFIVMLLDALSMLFVNNKSIKKPSFILSMIWNFIDYLRNPGGSNTHFNSTNNGIYKVLDKITLYLNKASSKIKNSLENIKSLKSNRRKYDTEREINKFDSKLGKKITIESISQGEKLKKKTFEYKDRAITYLKMLESNGYKNYTKYNIDINNTSAYIILNEKRDVIDLENNTIQITQENKDYQHVTNGWPKK